MGRNIPLLCLTENIMRLPVLVPEDTKNSLWESQERERPLSHASDHINTSANLRPGQGMFENNTPGHFPHRDKFSHPPKFGQCIPSTQQV